ncbi:MAG: hypothetical protein LBD67_02775 [Candidatus Accumulibacter sp.]|nr:hypothetical protein [Accumulibacter sp.]
MLKNVILISILRQASFDRLRTEQDEREWKTLSVLSLLSHRQHLSPFVVILPKHIDNTCLRSC